MNASLLSSNLSSVNLPVAQDLAVEVTASPVAVQVAAVEVVRDANLVALVAVVAVVVVNQEARVVVVEAPAAAAAATLLLVRHQGLASR